MKTRILIFGITGDLSRKKLLPALGDIVKSGEELSIIGVSRQQIEPGAILGTEPYAIWLNKRMSMYTMDLSKSDDYIRLKKYLRLKNDEQLLVYLSVPPNATTQIVSLLGAAGINSPNVKILFEKPFGLDLASANEMISETASFFKEEQIYRIDHYMAKEVASEIIRLRFDATTRHHGWDNKTISSIDITASETNGVGSRAASYEQTGALRDIIQSHLLQLTSLVLMDIPPDFAMDNLANCRKVALCSVRSIATKSAYRAQYKGYQEEVGNVGSQTETLALVKLESGNQKWKDVPITLITGKKLSAKKTQIAITYKDGTTDIFDEELLANGKHQYSAYQRVLLDAINSSKMIFTTGEEVICSWEILQPILDAWEMSDLSNLYEVGISTEQVRSVAKLA